MGQVKRLYTLDDILIRGSVKSDRINNGENNKGLKSDSFLSGIGLIGTEQYQTILGKYNENKTGIIFAIGVGTSDTNRKNAITVNSDGSVSIPSLKSSSSSISDFNTDNLTVKNLAVTNITTPFTVTTKDAVTIPTLSVTNIKSEVTFEDKTNFKGNGLELYYTTPYIDFHFNNDSGDQTSRIIENKSGILNINGATFDKNTSTVWTPNLTVDNAIKGNINGCAKTLARNGDLNYPMTFNWTGKDGQPTWLWGGEDGTTMYVYNPSNFIVKKSQYLYAQDNRTLKPVNVDGSTLGVYFSTIDGMYFTESGTDYCDVLVLNTWYNGTGGSVNALIFGKGNDNKGIYHAKSTYGSSSWEKMRMLAYADSVLPLSGGTITGDMTITGKLNMQGNSIEISDTLPYIDFHYNKDTGDHTSRIIENKSGILNINGATFDKNTSTVWTTNLSVDNTIKGSINGSASSLTLKGVETIGSVANDTIGNWASQKISVHRYDHFILGEQKTQYGLLLNVTDSGSEVHQIFMGQPGTSLYHRGGNSSGWATTESGIWREIIDSENYGKYKFARLGADELHTNSDNMLFDKLHGVQFSDNAGNKTSLYRSTTSDGGYFFYIKNTYGSTDDFPYYTGNISGVMYTQIKSNMLYIKASNTTLIDLNSNNLIDIQWSGSTPLFSSKGVELRCNSGSTWSAFYTSNTSNLGMSSSRWGYIYASHAVDTESDEKLKNYKEISEDKYDKFFMDLIPIQYTWKKSEDKSLHFGLGARHTEKVANENGINADDLELVQKHKSDESEDGLMYSMIYSELHGLEIHMIQKAHKKIEDLEKENQDLKDKIADLEAKIDTILSFIDSIPKAEPNDGTINAYTTLL